MSNEDIQALKKLLAGGKNCQLGEIYKDFYKKITGKTRNGRCGNCECKYLFAFLSGYITSNKL